MGENFSGSWSVTSRHPLLHSGVTNATRSARFAAEGVVPCRTRVLGAELDGSLATLNFREFQFFFYEVYSPNLAACLIVIVALVSY